MPRRRRALPLHLRALLCGTGVSRARGRLRLQCVSGVSLALRRWREAGVHPGRHRSVVAATGRRRRAALLRLPHLRRLLIGAEAGNLCASFRRACQRLEPTKRVAASVDVCVCRHIGSMCRGPLGKWACGLSRARGADDSFVESWPAVSDGEIAQAVP